MRINDLNSHFRCKVPSKINSVFPRCNTIILQADSIGPIFGM